MNFIEGKLNERRNIQTGYALNVLENIVVDAILDEAKNEIAVAIDQGKRHIDRYYTHDSEIGDHITLMTTDADAHLKYKGGSIPSFGDLVCRWYDNDAEKQAIRKAIEMNQEQLNLLRIETMVNIGLRDLGAKQVVAYVRCPNRVTVKVRKQGFWSNYEVEEERQIAGKRYLVCYSISW